ncbi:hypothetical protein [Acinetobacter baumannii]|uniref:Uncharacterized protein n=1 Tax=Acinetobacter baumannii TaxID=470 RepID=A0A6G0V7M6_ACIBA|nr:hypothetical protein [Acinetobacter baumannii]AIL78012.1 hypothetical protein IX87_04970 [Acinetobacter baumannii]AYY89934.1 hypothetical protein EGM95_14605 [Acinetobacter baumannii]EKT9116220.1 hypothetical protein [Acinetobacter baumannii]ENW41121.1 hypothetical protein F919_03657 [Acinetobacter baumannii NIPH 329]KAF0597301.1 hypothetical protein AB71190_02876 [Acinetobacter baumannii]
MSTTNNNDIFIQYTIDGSGEVKKLSVKAEDIYKDGVIDRSKVLSLAASNEASNGNAVINPIVLDSNFQPIN